LQNQRSRIQKNSTWKSRGPVFGKESRKFGESFSIEFEKKENLREASLEAELLISGGCKMKVFILGRRIFGFVGLDGVSWLETEVLDSMGTVGEVERETRSTVRNG